VVTGVSTGIGWGTTKVLVSKGFRVFGSVRKQTDADRLQREFGNGFVPLMMDITDADAVHQAAQKVGSMIGDRNLVGLVNNAGIVVSGPLLYLRPREYRRQLDVNIISPLVVIQAFAPLLGTDKERQGPTGRIVNISSTGAKVAIPLLGAYTVHVALSNGETEGTLRGRSATFQELDSAQTSSCEDARRPVRKAARTHKAVASLERRGSHIS
jgi:NAD(P)-dependent dehydrogenase (short-subunit alcohol dehydrogenase family)